MTQVKGSMSVLGLKRIGQVLQKLGKAVTYICMGQFTRLSASFAGDHDQSLTALIQTGQDNQ